MTPHAKLGIAGIIIGFILLFIVPWPIALALIVLAIAVPAGAWLMLDESQRRRYRELRRRQRGQIRSAAEQPDGRPPPEPRRPLRARSPADRGLLPGRPRLRGAAGDPRPGRLPARARLGQRPRPGPVRDRYGASPRPAGTPRALPPGLGGRHAGRPGRHPGEAGPGGRPGGGERPPGVQVAVRQGPERHRVRGHVAGARAGLGRRTGRWRDDRAARPGRRDRALGPGPGDRRRGRLPDVTPKT